MICIVFFRIFAKIDKGEYKMETIAKRRMKRTVKQIVTPASEKVRLKKKRPLLHIRGKELVEDPFNLN